MPVLGPPLDTAQDALEAAIAITNDAAASPVYTGNASVTNNSAGVSWVSGPPFTAAMVGSGILLAGVSYQVSTVPSATSLTLTTVYAGTTGTVVWKITPALLTGNVLNPLTNPAVWVLMNFCYRDLEDELLRMGVETFTSTKELLNLEPTQTTAIRDLLYIDWSGYWDGNTKNPNVTLPDDLLQPLRLWECPSGSNMDWLPMRQAPDQLEPDVPTDRIERWGFWDNTLYIRQFTVQMDVKIRYLATAPDITDGTSVLVIRNSKNALAYRVAEAAAASRGGIEMATFYASKAKQAEARISSRTARREDYSRFTRKPFRGQHRGQGRGRGFWAGPIVTP